MQNRVRQVALLLPSLVHLSHVALYMIHLTNVFCRSLMRAMSNRSAVDRCSLPPSPSVTVLPQACIRILRIENPYRRLTETCCLLFSFDPHNVILLTLFKAAAAHTHLLLLLFLSPCISSILSHSLVCESLVLHLLKCNQLRLLLVCLCCGRPPLTPLLLLLLLLVQLRDQVLE